MSKANPRKLAKIFKTLSVDTRVQIIQLLKERMLCVGAIAARLDVSAAAVSQHLRILRSVDLVIPEKRGYYVHYRLNNETMEEWADFAETFLRWENSGKQQPCDGRS